MTDPNLHPAPHPSGRPDVYGKRLLDPIDRFSEILFGLIMVLSFTGSLSVATAGREEVRTMLVGAIGCNLAWGIVDAVMYVIGIVTQRQRDRTLLRTVLDANSPAAVRSAMSYAVHPDLLDAVTDDELERARQRLAAHHGDPGSGSVETEDFLAAGAVFAMVFASTLPVVIPFIILQNAAVALRTSNAVAVVMLFLAGCSLGRFSGFGQWRTGAVMVAIGLVLVAVTMALGG